MATKADRDALVLLLEEMSRYWWGSASPEAGASQARADALLDDPATCDALVAEDDSGALVGLATFSLLQSAPGTGGTLFMKDLFVSDAGRSNGLGTQMMRALAKIARDRGCGRFDWTAERDNPRALDLYHRLGAEVVPEKVYFRLTGDALADMAPA